MIALTGHLLPDLKKLLLESLLLQGDHTLVLSEVQLGCLVRGCLRLESLLASATVLEALGVGALLASV